MVVEVKTLTERFAVLPAQIRREEVWIDVGKRILESDPESDPRRVWLVLNANGEGVHFNERPSIVVGFRVKCMIRERATNFFDGLVNLRFHSSRSCHRAQRN